MIREVNINFEARQAVVYDKDGNYTRFVGNDFNQFAGVQQICEQAGVKTAEQAKAEKLSKIDEQIQKLQAERDDVVNDVKPKPITMPGADIEAGV
jgi:hypothetical protein